MARMAIDHGTALRFLECKRIRAQGLLGVWALACFVVVLPARFTVPFVGCLVEADLWLQ